MRSSQIDKAFDKIHKIRITELDENKVEQDLNFIALCCFKELENVGKFKLGKTQLRSRSKLFDIDGQLHSRGFQCKNKYSVNFMRNTDSEVEEMLPEKYLTLVKDVFKFIKEYKEEMKTMFTDTNSQYGYNQAKKVPVFEKLVELNAFVKGSSYNDEEPIKKVEVQKIDCECESSGYEGNIRYKIKVYDSTNHSVEKDNYVFYTNDNMFNEMKIAVNKCKQHNKKMKKQQKNAYHKITRMIMAKGFDKYLVLRGI